MNDLEKQYLEEKFRGLHDKLDQMREWHKDHFKTKEAVGCLETRVGIMGKFMWLVAGSSVGAIVVAIKEAIAR